MSNYRIRETLSAILLSTLIFQGCREVPTTPEPGFTKERMRFIKMLPDTINTKNGEFSVVYIGKESGGPFGGDYGILKMGRFPDNTTKNYEVNTTDKSILWFSKNGVTREYSEMDPSLVIRYLGNFVCEAYLIKQN